MLINTHTAANVHSASGPRLRQNVVSAKAGDTVLIAVVAESLAPDCAARCWVSSKCVRSGFGEGGVLVSIVGEHCWGCAEPSAGKKLRARTRRRENLGGGGGAHFFFFFCTNVMELSVASYPYARTSGNQLPVQWDNG